MCKNKSGNLKNNLLILYVQKKLQKKSWVSLKLFWFFCKMVWKNLNELLGQHNILSKLVRISPRKNNAQEFLLNNVILDQVWIIRYGPIDAFSVRWEGLETMKS